MLSPATYMPCKSIAEKTSKNTGCTLGESVVLGLMNAVPASVQHKMTKCFDRFFVDRRIIQTDQMLCGGRNTEKSKKPTKIKQQTRQVRIRLSALGWSHG